MRHGLKLLLPILGLTLGLSSAQAADPAQGCFFISQFKNYKAPDEKTILIRVNFNDFYRLDLAGACPRVTSPNAHLLTKTRGPDTVCTALDWDISVQEPGSPAIPCIVKSMTKLSDQEVAAIPPKMKP